jgi:adenine deaminase
MKLLIRDGSASQDFNELILVGGMYPNDSMFCSDDKHPDDLQKGHINLLVKRGLEFGIDIMKLLRMACVNPVEHYGLDVGLLRKNDTADFIVVNSLEKFDIQKTYINGQCVYRKGWPLALKIQSEKPNNFHCHEKEAFDFYVDDPYKESPVIEVHDKKLYTNRLNHLIKNSQHNLVSDVHEDIIKIAVINRYENKLPTLSFVKGFGLKTGAIASSVAHDSHNIICVGVSEEDMRDAVNQVIKHKGGISVVSHEKDISEILPLPIAGLMSDKSYSKVASDYAQLDLLAKNLGSTLSAPFMTLSFMTLLVMPEIKLSDKGLFDVNSFSFIS